MIAKLLAALRVSTVLTFLLTEQLLLAYILLPELRDRFWTLIVFLLIIATTCLATSTIGLMCSALARRTSTAMVLTYLTLLLLFVAADRSGAVSPGDQLGHRTSSWPRSRSQARSRRHSACRCTRLRNEMWTSQRPYVPDPVLVSITGRLAMPVWAIFLCLYPPLSMGLLFLTYLTFRWRGGVRRPGMMAARRRPAALRAPSRGQLARGLTAAPAAVSAGRAAAVERGPYGSGADITEPPRMHHPDYVSTPSR